MSYKIELSENFKKEANKLIKKYPSLKTELAELFTVLETNTIIPLILKILIHPINPFFCSVNTYYILRK